MGLKGFRYLKKFRKENLDELLKACASDYISTKLTIDCNSHLIVA